jgi:hypothetical protein
MLGTTNIEDSKNMSRTRRNLNAKFKSDLVLEVLKGKKDHGEEILTTV